MCSMFQQLSDYERTKAFFLQHSATAEIANRFQRILLMSSVKAQYELQCIYHAIN
jgi:hypothetical protein